MAAREVVFDIETVPEYAAQRSLLGLAEDVSNEEVDEAWTASRRPFKPLLQRVIVIAVAVIEEDGHLSAWKTLGPPGGGEREMIQAFFSGLAHSKPRLVGWNSSGFDLPVLLLRATVQGIQAPEFYQVGQPYHGYLRRYDEEQHVDLMDQWAQYRATVPLALDEAAALFGLPGKLGVDGSDVAALYASGAQQMIEQYCMSDVMTTALLYASYAYHRGWWTAARLQTFEASAEEALSGDERWAPFRSTWRRMTGT